MEHDESLQWQKSLYKKIGSKKGSQQDFHLDYAIERVMAMAKVLYGLHLVGQSGQTPYTGSCFSENSYVSKVDINHGKANGYQGD